MPVAKFYHWVKVILLQLHACTVNQAEVRQNLMDFRLNIRHIHQSHRLVVFIQTMEVQLAITLSPTTARQVNLLIWIVSEHFHDLSTLYQVEAACHQHHNQWWDNLAPRFLQAHKRSTSARFATSVLHDQAHSRLTFTVTLERSHSHAKLKAVVAISQLFPTFVATKKFTRITAMLEISQTMRLKNGHSSNSLQITILALFSQSFTVPYDMTGDSLDPFRSLA